MFQGKIVALHAMKAYNGVETIDPSILKLSRRWSGQLHAPVILLSKNTPVPTEKERLGGHQSRSRLSGAEKSLLSLSLRNRATIP
jgi:hypothetical protein